MIIVSVIGAGLVAYGIWSFKSHSKFMQTAVRTMGKIVEVRTERRTDTDQDGYSSNYNAFIPVISFNVDGIEHSFVSTVESRSKRKYKVGNSIDIYYDPQNPANAKVKSTVNNWIMPFVIIIVGVMMIFIGLTQSTE